MHPPKDESEFPTKKDTFEENILKFFLKGEAFTKFWGATNQNTYGRCCGNFDCCTYYKYYEAWWFWLVWVLITILACCCTYHRRRYYAYHGQIRNFVHPALLDRSAESSTPYQELTVDPKYKLPSYAEVEAMGSLGPPVDVAGAPPPYVDPLANEEQEDDAVNSHSNDAFLDSSADHLDLCDSSLITTLGNQRSENS